MVAAVLDEDAADFDPAEDRAGEVEVGDIGFERLQVVRGDAVGPFERNAAALEEREIRLVADQREDGAGGELLPAGAPLHSDAVRLDRLDAGAEEGPDLAGGDPVLQVGLDPVLD